MNTPHATEEPKSSLVSNVSGGSNAPNVPVLMYHHISPAGGMICTTPELFDDQLTGLARAGYRTLTAAQFAAYLAGEPVPEKSVLLTFDDGYLNNWVYAHPILQRHGMHAVLFAVTGWIGSGPCRPYLSVPQPLPDERRDDATLPDIAPVLTESARRALPACPDHAACKAAIAEGRADDVMTRWEELRAMQQAGTFEIFSHTHTHTRWDSVPGLDAMQKRRRVDEELRTSRQALLAHLGTRGDHLCWPQGYFDAEYVAAAQDAGFTHLYTTDPWGQNRPGNDPGHIFRFAVRNRGADWLLRRLWLTRHPRLGPYYHAFKAWKKRSRRRA